jgi:hypothetical protein
MDAIGVIFGIAWYIVGFWGLAILRKKGYLDWFFGMGAFMFFLYGWAIALIFLFIPGMLGPITWGLAKYVLPDRRTPATWAAVRPE